MKNLTKFITLLSILILCSFIWIPSAYAAVKVPDRTGIVTDTAQLFTTQELRQLEQSLSGREYQLVVLTASGLNEREGEQLANDAYDQWKLKTNELILVITVNPRYVHLIFDSSVLAEQIEISDARNVKGVIDRTFVPYASDGRVADGVIALSEYVNSLPPLVPNESVPPQQQEQPRPAIPIEESKQTNSGPAWIWLLLIAAGIGILLLLKQFLYAGNLRRQLNELQQQHSKLTPMISKMMVSSLFKELENGFVQGETAKQLAELEQTVLKQHKQARDFAEQLAMLKIPLFASSRMKRSINGLAKEMEQFAGAVKQQNTEYERLEQLSKDVRREVEEAKIQSQQLAKSVDRISNEYHYPLTSLKQQLEQANRILAEADRLDEFDFVQAGRLVEQLRKYYDLLNTAVKDYHQYVIRYREYPRRIDAHQKELQEIVQRERLLLTDGDPEGCFQKARTALERLAPYLEEGNVEAILRTLDTIEDQLKQAKSMISSMIEHRDHAKGMAGKIEEELIQLRAVETTYEQERARFQSMDPSHSQQSHYVLMIQYKHELESLLQEIKASLDPQVQRYKLAFERAERAKTIIEELRQLRQQQAEALRAYEQLQRDYQARMRQYGRGFNHGPYSNRYGGLQSTIEQLIMLGLFTEAIKQISAGRGILTQMDHDYRRMLERERQRQMHRHGGGPFGGPFGGGMGGRRPGGGGFGGSSGWGGGGRSGGSSSWGGGGRSGGSSSWGGGRSGGGRSSGSSKW